jgi:hypothetical protein
MKRRKKAGNRKVRRGRNGSIKSAALNAAFGDNIAAEQYAPMGG